MRIPAAHCAFYWLVEHAAWVLITRPQQSDGITPCKRLRGTNFNVRMLGFGESCLYKLNRKAPGKSLDGKMEARWADGIFLGYSRDLNEFVLWDVKIKKIVRARSVQRKSESQRWESKALAEVSQRPQDVMYRSTAAPIRRKELAEDFKDKEASEDEPPRTRASSAHDLKVIIEDLKKHRFIEVGCERCDYIKEHGHARGCGYAHTRVCRERIRRAPSDTAEGRTRLNRVDERMRGQRGNDKVDPDGALKKGQEEPSDIDIPTEDEEVEEAEGSETNTGLESRHGAGDDDSIAASSPARSDGMEASINEDQDMTLLERESPLNQLLQLSEEISQEAIKNKLEREPLENIVEELKKGDKVSPKIASLPESAIKYLGDEMIAFCKEAKKVGIECSKKLPVFYDEVNLTVSEICSPPKVIHAARILKKLGISSGFALDITVKDEDGKPWDFSKEAQKEKA